MTARVDKASQALRNLACARLQSVAEQAVQAQKFGPDDDRLLDLIDSIDADLQEAIALINRVRSGE